MGREIRLLGCIIVISFIWFYFVVGMTFLIGLARNVLFHPGMGAWKPGPGDPRNVQAVMHREPVV
jgi:hypothetical protein